MLSGFPAKTCCTTMGFTRFRFDREYNCWIRHPSVQLQLPLPRARQRDELIGQKWTWEEAEGNSCPCQVLGCVAAEAWQGTAHWNQQAALQGALLLCWRPRYFLGTTASSSNWKKHFLGLEQGGVAAEIEEIVTSLLIEHSKPQLRFRFFTCDMSVSYLSVRFEEGVQIRLNFW